MDSIVLRVVVLTVFVGKPISNSPENALEAAEGDCDSSNMWARRPSRVELPPCRDLATPGSNSSVARIEASVEGAPNRQRSDSGFALVFVIWAIGILALLFTTYVVAARYRSVEVASLTARAKANAMASAAVKIAVFDLLAGMNAGRVQSKRFPANGAVVVCLLGQNSRVAISVVDEAGKVDLNASTEDVLRALLRNTMRTRRAADDLADRILELRKAPERINTGSNDPNAVPNAKIRTIYELEQVTDIDRETTLVLLPLVTVHSGSPGVDATVASPRVFGALAANVETPFARGPGLRPTLPSAFTAVSPARVFSIAARVETADGTTGVREAIVEFSPDFPNGHKVHEWRDRLLDVPDLGAGSGSLNPC